MLVGSVMSASPSVARAGESVVDVARRMRARAIGFLPILDDAELVGVITDRDLVDRVLAARRDPEATPVDAVMSRQVTTAFDDEDAVAAVERMSAAAVRRLVVLARRDESVVGVLSVDDLALQHETRAAAIGLLRRLAQLRTVELDGIASDEPRP